MFERLDCVSIHTDDIGASLAFLLEMGMVEAWRLERRLEDGRSWTLLGLDFPDRTSSQLVLSNHPERRDIEVEIRVEDVRATYARLQTHPGVGWIAEPFAIEAGTVAVMTAPDGNLFVLIDGAVAGVHDGR
jgi:catechol 2,3-dioxygenase-like lactoylglutathione lyase family enzyme